MLVIKAKNELITVLNSLKTGTKKIGFIPTMGALHLGHASLIAQSKKDNDISVVSIFVNPTQFLPHEDLSKYPRPLEADLAVCEKLGVDVVFLPSVEEMYEKDPIKVSAPKFMGYVFEGFLRPGHFDGVLTIVLKFFNLILPDNAYFGKKDAQQLLMIQKMVKSLNLPINVIGMPLIRDKDNLAFSSRNVYLSKEGRKDALCLSAALFTIEERVKKGIKDVEALKKGALESLSEVYVEYFEFVDKELHITTKLEDSIVIAVIRVENIRLLDNLWISDIMDKGRCV
ncbi:pantoate--beta-alanine ligase [Helicobacter sp. 11S02629-2]|uniref:pantoate--beta-alanine ligase n=1 Tax=Helicobacter sp. 11S02629-2 TaxID=1476195 RepID=UPI000BA7C572|nr:pantoate--beta-alanine ligase [Helicobacter sp. 11S02629-2]PAF45480.1 pantoate--beta-alanine ligase [Helicobacter sp. 11S02629-2]